MSERRLGPAQSGIKMIPAGLNVRFGMATTECVALGAGRMAGATTLGRMVWRIRNREGPKRAGENRHLAGGRDLRTEQFT